MGPPRNRTQLKSFLGLAGYFRSSIPNFAGKVKNLTYMLRGNDTKNNEVFLREWTTVQQEAFDEILESIGKVQMLEFIDYNAPIQIRTDASQTGCGAVLFQTLDGKEKPVAFLSKTFSPAESRWSTIEQETFAVFYACDHGVKRVGS